VLSKPYVRGRLLAYSLEGSLEISFLDCSKWIVTGRVTGRGRKRAGEERPDRLVTEVSPGRTSHSPRLIAVRRLSTASRDIDSVARTRGRPVSTETFPTTNVAVSLSTSW